MITTVSRVLFITKYKDYSAALVLPAQVKHVQRVLDVVKEPQMEGKEKEMLLFHSTTFIANHHTSFDPLKVFKIFRKRSFHGFKLFFNSENSHRKSEEAGAVSKPDRLDSSSAADATILWVEMGRAQTIKRCQSSRAADWWPVGLTQVGEQQQAWRRSKGGTWTQSD